MAFIDSHEGLDDRRTGNSECREGKEHEDHGVDPLDQIHRRHLRRHRSHDAQCPVETENVLLVNGPLRIRPWLATVCPATARHCGPMRHVVPLQCIRKHLWGERIRFTDNPEEARIPVADEYYGTQHFDHNHTLHGQDRRHVRLDEKPNFDELRQAQHPQESEDPQQIHKLDGETSLQTRDDLSNLPPRKSTCQVQREPLLQVVACDENLPGHQGAWLRECVVGTGNVPRHEVEAHVCQE
mmetsp:Transcript_43758/g.115581  ORF Transcript_43758/g.115581 Transcript_43758/m.115581 type:complete len:240 (+) Transcript_43758:1162-1881(+)